MATAYTGRHLVRSAARVKRIAIFDLPHFLCTSLLRTTPSLVLRQSRLLRHFQTRPHLRCIHSQVIEDSTEVIDLTVVPPQLPNQCAGCGALSQTSDAGEPGFYTTTRKSVQTYFRDGPRSSKDNGTQLNAEALEVVSGIVDSSILDLLRPAETKQSSPSPPPVCDRCHNLRHHQTGVSIHHPTIQSLHDTILESPYKNNHIYHIIDAADFPMSLIPSLHRTLEISPQRSRNRRSKTDVYSKGKKTEVSFIITRSDLLAPVKAQVDSLMPYLVEVLRDALGSYGKDVRLGNVRCVSARRDWWTKELKEDIWKSGGGGWMVGKVNVGKSRLFESVFPKGRAEVRDPSITIQETPKIAPHSINSLLPPAPEEVNYPEMPLVHPLPGTTASPIRVPFGKGKGELIDLPGLSRGDLELYVQESHRLSLVMRSRVVPEQQVIKPGQSLLLGGFIRITPLTDDIILAYSFTPISPHLSATEKAIAIQKQERDTGVENISVPGTGEKIQSAGKFQLKWDVTKQRSGPLTRKDAVGLKLEQLPYRVVATDILIEGCGWVELVCQVRRSRFEAGQHPEVEVFTPKGNFIGSRRCMSGWLLGGPRGENRARGRPRKSMKGAKKKEKRHSRAMSATF